MKCGWSPLAAIGRISNFVSVLFIRCPKPNQFQPMLPKLLESTKMIYSKQTFIAASACFLLILSPGAFAERDPTNERDEDVRSDGEGDAGTRHGIHKMPYNSSEILPPKTDGTLSETTTAQIVIELRDAAAFCRGIGKKEYVIDCMAYEYRRIAAALPRHGEYAAVKKNINKAAASFEKIVSSNQSREIQPKRATSGGKKPRRTASKLRAVSTKSLPQAAKMAANVIKETQTVLLRSSENSTERRRQFQQIVSAMDTGTILLRSI